MASVASSSSSGAPAPFSVLLVVQDAAPALALARRAHALGFCIEVARSSLAALASLSVAHYDAVVMEAGFPMVDGLEAVRRLRRFEGWLESLPRPSVALPAAARGKSAGSAEEEKAAMEEEVVEEEDRSGSSGTGGGEDDETTAVAAGETGGAIKPPAFVVLVRNGYEPGEGEGGASRSRKRLRQGAKASGGFAGFEAEALRAGADWAVDAFADVRYVSLLFLLLWVHGAICI
jgi:CheY-like chemotaxis protein